MKIPYSDEDIQYVKDNFRTTSALEMSKKLGRTPGSVKGLMERFELKRTPEEVALVFSKIKGGAKRGDIEPGRMYTPDDMQYLRDNYVNKTADEMAAHLKRDRRAIREKLQKMGLAVAPKFPIEGNRMTDMEKWLQENILVYKSNRFGDTGDIKVISRSDYAKFTAKRKIRMAKEKVEQDKKDVAKAERAAAKQKIIDAEIAEKNMKKAAKIAKIAAASLKKQQRKDAKKQMKEEAKRQKEEAKAAAKQARRQMNEVKKVAMTPKQMARDFKKVHVLARAMDPAVSQGEFTAQQRKKARKEMEAKQEEFLKNYQHKNIEETLADEMAHGKVPVALDERTTIMVDRAKCVQIPDGKGGMKWVKKISQQAQAQ